MREPTGHEVDVQLQGRCKASLEVLAQEAHGNKTRNSTKYKRMCTEWGQHVLWDVMGTTGMGPRCPSPGANNLLQQGTLPFSADLIDTCGKHQHRFHHGLNFPLIFTD